MSTQEDKLRERLSHMLPEIPLLHSDEYGDIEVLLSSARSAFSRGFNKALAAQPGALSFLLNDEPVATRGFALEGAAMAITLLDELTDSRQRQLNTFLAGRSSTQHVLCAIGIGWAGARLRKPFYWVPPEFNRQYANAVVDGYGFHQGFFHPQRFEGRGFPRETGQWSKYYDAGLGRALWFIHVGRIEPIVRIIDNLSPIRKMDFWRGVGTACAFTGCTKEASTTLIEAAATFKTHVRAGLEAGTALQHALAQSNKEVMF